MTDHEPWLDRAIDDLYAGELDQFTSRRTELAKAARADGDKAAATAITALRKPTQSAFTINRLARTDPSSIATLIEVGGDLRRAQRSADGKQLRELNTRRRAVLDTLTRRAFEIIGQQSPSCGQREEVSATLTAALADPTVAEQLRHGILVRAAESSGFGFSPPELTLIRSPRTPTDTSTGTDPDATAPVSSGPTEDPTGPDRAIAQRKARAATAAAERTARVEAEAERRRTAREATIAKARADADAADLAVEDAVADIDRNRQLIRQLQRQLTDAKKELEDSQLRAKAAHTRQRKAREVLNKASG